VGVAHPLLDVQPQSFVILSEVAAHPARATSALAAT